MLGLMYLVNTIYSSKCSTAYEKVRLVIFHVMWEHLSCNIVNWVTFHHNRAADFQISYNVYTCDKCVMKNWAQTQKNKCNFYYYFYNFSVFKIFSRVYMETFLSYFIRFFFGKFDQKNKKKIVPLRNMLQYTKLPKKRTNPMYIHDNMKFW